MSTALTVQVREAIATLTLDTGRRFVWTLPEVAELLPLLKPAVAARLEQAVADFRTKRPRAAGDR